MERTRLTARKPRKWIEQDLQKAVVKHLVERGERGLVWFHPPNGGFLGGKKNRNGHVIQRGILTGMGMRAGVSDLIFLHRGRYFALELKAPGGVATEEQLAFIADVNNARGYAAIADSLDRALAILERWELLRGTAQIGVAA